jgi:hypothetical protein
MSRADRSANLESGAAEAESVKQAAARRIERRKCISDIN